jgi:hypothetical protein
MLRKVKLFPDNRDSIVKTEKAETFINIFFVYRCNNADKYPFKVDYISCLYMLTNTNSFRPSQPGFSYNPLTRIIKGE